MEAMTVTCRRTSPYAGLPLTTGVHPLDLSKLQLYPLSTTCTIGRKLDYRYSTIRRSVPEDPHHQRFSRSTIYTIISPTSVEARITEDGPPSPPGYFSDHHRGIRSNYATTDSEHIPPYMGIFRSLRPPQQTRQCQAANLLTQVI